MRRHGADQRFGPRHQRNASVEVIERRGVEPRQQAHALLQRRLEIELAAHGARGDAGGVEPFAHLDPRHGADRVAGGEAWQPGPLLRPRAAQPDGERSQHLCAHECPEPVVERAHLRSVPVAQSHFGGGHESQSADTQRAARYLRSGLQGSGETNHLVRIYEHLVAKTQGTKQQVDLARFRLSRLYQGLGRNAEALKLLKEIKTLTSPKVAQDIAVLERKLGAKQP